MNEKSNDDTEPAFTSIRDFQVAIIGLGLMGASLASALRGQCRKVIGVDMLEETVATAINRNMIDYGTTDIFSGIKEANAVILATPVRAIISLLDKLGPRLPDGCFIMDLGSTKTEITKKMEGLPTNLHAIGGHPMCGKEVSGINSSDPLIYKNALFILTPLKEQSTFAQKIGIEIVSAIGARALVLDPARHDMLVAIVSHLPYLLACGLVASAGVKAQQDELLWAIAASGFGDTSRLAASDVTMMLDIIMTNPKAIEDALDNYESSLREIKNLVNARDEEKLHVMLTSIRNLRINNFQKR